MSKDRGLSPTSINQITAEDVQQLKKMSWSTEDKKRMKASQFDGLPLHLQKATYIIGTTGHTNWIKQGNIYIPGNSVMHLYNASGTVDMGWGRLVRPTGHFVDDGSVMGPAEAGFTRPGRNKYCMLVGTFTTEGTLNYYFYNSRIPNWGASVGDLSVYWPVPANAGGYCVVAFNDQDINNSGGFSQFMDITQASTFAEMIAHLADV